MKTISILSAAAVLFLAIPSQAATSSATSGFFTVDTREFAIEDVSSPYCSGAYNNGAKGTFIAGIRCKIDFKTKITAPEGGKVKSLLLNGKSINSTEEFTFDVGSLKVGEKLEVVAVADNGSKSKPFRVNLDMASLPYNFFMKEAAYANFDADHGRVVYTSPQVHPLFVFEDLENVFEIADEEFPFNWKPSFSVADVYVSDTAQMTSGVGGGLATDWNWVGDMGWMKDLKKQKIGKFSGAEISLELSGGSTYEWNPSSRSWSQVSREIGGTFSASITPIRFRIPQTLWLAYVSLEGYGSGSITIIQENDTLRSEYALNPLIGLKGTLGAGVPWVLCLESWASGGVVMSGSVPGNPDILQEIGMQVSAGGRFEVVGFDWPKEWSWTYWIKPQGRNNLVRSNSAFLRSSPVESSGGEGWRVMSRDYRQAKRLLGGSLRGSSAAASLGDGYPNPAPSMACLGAQDALVYLTDSAARSAINRTLAVCRTGTSNEWDSAEAVWDDGTADFMPKVSIAGDGTLFAVWVNAKRAFDDNEDFETVCKSMEIAAAVRRAGSAQWECMNLTDDASFDISPVVKTAPDGTAAVAWIRNSAGDVFGSSASPNSIMTAVYRNGAWSEPFVAVPDAGIVTAFDLAWKANSATVFWSKDGDGNPESSQDHEVWSVVVQNSRVTRSAKRISSRGKDAHSPSAWLDARGAVQSLWIENGALVSTAGAVSGGANVNAPYSLLPHDDGMATLVWQRLSAGQSVPETVCATLNPVVRRIGDETVLIAEPAAVARAVSGTIGGDGALRMAYESVAFVASADGKIEYGPVELKTMRHEGGVNIGFDQNAVSFSGELAIGQSANIVANVRNLGSMTADGVEVNVWLGAGEDKTFVGTAVTNIPPLSSATVSIPWVVEPGLEELVFSLEALPSSAQTDTDDTDNVCVWCPEEGESKLALDRVSCSASSDTLRTITASVRNDGVLAYPAGLRARFWRGNVGATLLGEKAFAAIPGGGQGNVEYVWDVASMPMTNAVERVVVELLAGDEHPVASAQVEGRVWNIRLDARGGILENDVVQILRGRAMPDLPVPERRGWKFTGWYSMPEAGEEILTGLSVSRDMEIYAHWTAVYYVQFDSNGGEEKFDEIEIGEQLALGAVPQTTREGAQFDGWWTQKAGGRRIDGGTIISSDSVFYAHWLPEAATMKVSSTHIKEGEGVEVVVSGGNGKYGSSLKLCISYNNSSFADFDFARGTVDGVVPRGGLKFPLALEWDANEIGAKTIFIPVKADKSVEGDEFFVLQLSDPSGMDIGDESSCRIAIEDSNDKQLKASVIPYKPAKGETPVTNNVTVTGTKGGFVAGTGLYTSGSKLTLAAEPRPGWAFIGWTLKDGDGSILSNKAKYQIAIEKDAQYVALFEELPYICALAEPAEGGKVSGSAYCAANAKTTLKAAANRNFTFLGWFAEDGRLVASTPTLVVDRSAKHAADTKTSTTITNIAQSATFTAQFSSDPKVVVDCDPAAGKATGAGRYAPGKKFSLRATPAKGYVFTGWSDETGLLSLNPTWTQTMPSNDVFVAANFITKEADAQSISGAVAIDGSGYCDLALVSQFESTCGVLVEMPLASQAASATTVKVAGLPTGLKLVVDRDSGQYSIYGIPTTAKTFNAKLTISTAGGNSKTFAFAWIVEPLPSWATGKFSGESFMGCCADENLDGLVQNLSISKAGKISGKVLRDGKSWTLNAGSFLQKEYQSDDDSWAFTGEMTLKTGSGRNAQEHTIEYSLHPDVKSGIECGVIHAVSPEDVGFRACQDLWGQEPFKTLAKAVARLPQMVLAGTEDGLPGDNDTVAIKFGAGGKVTAAARFSTQDARTGKAVVYNATCSSVIVPYDDDAEFLGYVVLYFPPKSGTAFSTPLTIKVDISE